MSLSASTSSKKRKHAEVNENASGTSSHKKAKKDSKDKKKSTSKTDRQFQVVNASIAVSIPPRFAMEPMTGAKEMLDSLIMRHVPALGGVMLSHSNARFLSQAAVIRNECPFSNCSVGFDATVWSPRIGMKLKGKINLCSPDHISLLVHRTFNVSIPRHHIPIDHWEFEYGALENDPEFGPNAPGQDETEENVEDTMEAEGKVSGNAGAEETEETIGVWVHKITGDRLGGDEGQLDFTIIDLTVANQMLSLVGSIQPDPFSPEHVPKPAVAKNSETDEEPDDGNEESDEEDPFSNLARAAKDADEREAAEKEQKARDKEEKKRKKKEKKEKKEKRK
ncbi:hypothetical protein DFH11DRAFT_1696937, partial [Phellopilus nigrolimitatus]